MKDYLEDIHGKKVKIGSTIIMPWENSDEGKLCLETFIVVGINVETQSIFLNDDPEMDYPLNKFDIYLVE